MFDSIDVSKNIFDFHFKNNPTSPAVNAGTSHLFLMTLMVIKEMPRRILGVMKDEIHSN